MDELRKASILLKHLAPGERSQILGRLELEQRTHLEQMVTDAPEVSRDELAGIVSEYQAWLQRLSVNRTAGVPASEERELDSPEDDGLNPQFTLCDAQQLTERLREEPATVLCAVLCHLHEAVARELYDSLREDRKAEVASRLPGQADITPIVKQELDRYLNEPAAGREGEKSPGSVLLSRLVGT